MTEAEWLADSEPWTLLEFLGEIGGENPDLIQFVSTREAQRALKDAEKEKSKEDHDE